MTEPTPRPSYDEQARAAKRANDQYHAGVDAARDTWIKAGRPWSRNAERRGWIAEVQQ